MLHVLYRNETTERQQYDTKLYDSEWNSGHVSNSCVEHLKSKLTAAGKLLVVSSGNSYRQISMLSPNIPYINGGCDEQVSKHFQNGN